ncbi:MAG: 4-(cytidine 5'-diphospho)-2-C-methyl-D-erythritol kinase, partial [Desulfobacteraceae bacterium]
MEGLLLEAPAKLNVRLKVTGRRPDGYHELVSVMVPVDLVDRVYVEETGRPGVTFRSSGLPVPEGKDNLAVRAAYTFLSKADQDRGLLVELEKRIPAAAGLGGGSSDAGAVLRAMHRIYPGVFSEEELVREAASLGADVPFFI